MSEPKPKPDGGPAEDEARQRALELFNDEIDRIIQETRRRLAEEQQQEEENDDDHQ